MAEPKSVRLRDVNSGVVVSVSEETATALSGFESADDAPKTARKTAAKKSDNE